MSKFHCLVVFLFIYLLSHGNAIKRHVCSAYIYLVMYKRRERYIPLDHYCFVPVESLSGFKCCSLAIENLWGGSHVILFQCYSVLNHPQLPGNRIWNVLN